MIIFRKAVLMIHGFAGGTHDQERLANHLEKKWNLDVYSFTLPGHEKRKLKTVGYEEWIKASENQVNKLISLGYNEIYLIGHSMGGVIATYLANRYPSVKKLVLAAPSFHYITKSTEASIIEKIKSGLNAIKSNDPSEVITRFLKLPIASLKEFTKLVEQYRNEYEKIKIPTLILQGDKDTLVPPETNEKIYKSLKCNKKKFLLLPGIDHDLFGNASEEILKEVEKFLV